MNPFAESAKYFDTPLQMAQYLNKYSRYDYEKGRRETWVETVDRVVNFLMELSENKLDQSDYDLMRQYILEMKAMPAMRVIATAGEVARRNNIAVFNCSAVGVDSIDAFVEALIISMNGCGVGYSVESRFVNQLPVVKPQNGKPSDLFVIPDTTEGWADALRYGLTAWLNGDDIRFDYSLIRPFGAPLRTKGGTASGHGVLKELLDFTRTTILNRQGEKLTSVDCHDIMCMVGYASIAGSSRRSALISLFDVNDPLMNTCKDDDVFHYFDSPKYDGSGIWEYNLNTQRGNANNSGVWTELLDRDDVAQYVNTMHASGRGEPGIFSRYAAQLTIPLRRKQHQWLTNPCVTKDTWVMTTEGAKRVGQLIGKQFSAVVDGKVYGSTDQGFVFTGNKKILTINLDNGMSINVTDNHQMMKVNPESRGIVNYEWIEAGKLLLGDNLRINNHRGYTSWGNDDGLDYKRGWIIGSLIGDGTFSKGVGNRLDLGILRYWGDNQNEMAEKAMDFVSAVTSHRSDLKPRENTVNNYTQICSTGIALLAKEYNISVESKNITDVIEQQSSEFYKGFISGYFDADGTVLDNTQKGASVRLAQSNYENLQVVQRMLLRLGITSKLYQNRRDEGYKYLPDGRGDSKPYFCKAAHELIISKEDIKVFAENIGFLDTHKHEKLQQLLSSYIRDLYKSKFYSKIISITKSDDSVDVYDCTIPELSAFDANGFYVHNCGEILLRHASFCNLSIAVGRANDTLESLANKVRVATILGTIQSLATDFKGLRQIWQDNCNEERLLGVDVTGQMDCPVFRSAEAMQYLKNIAIETNKEYAAKLGINQSVAVTCVKPAGNSSVVLNAGSGLHAWHSQYYIRNIRLGAHDPVLKVLEAHGIRSTPENGQSDETAITRVVGFPVKAPDGAIIKEGRSALEQLEYWKLVKLNWCEHTASATIHYKPDELEAITDWIYENQTIISGLSFLPLYDANYPQMPYEKCSKEEYETALAAFPKEIDWSILPQFEATDMTTAAQELACVSGLCEIF